MIGFMIILCTFASEVTLMLGNIPREISQPDLITILETRGYCRGRDFNFLFAPPTFLSKSRKQIKGYAFINFCRTDETFVESLRKRLWINFPSLSIKIASTQGFQDNALTLAHSKILRLRNREMYAPQFFDLEGNLIALENLPRRYSKSRFKSMETMDDTLPNEVISEDFSEESASTQRFGSFDSVPSTGAASKDTLDGDRVLRHQQMAPKIDVIWEDTQNVPLVGFRSSQDFSDHEEPTSKQRFGSFDSVPSTHADTLDGEPALERQQMAPKIDVIWKDTQNVPLVGLRSSPIRYAFDNRPLLQRLMQ